MTLSQFLMPHPQCLEVLGIELQALARALGSRAFAVAKWPQGGSALPTPLTRRDDAQRPAQREQHLRKLVAAPTQSLAQRLVLLERGAHRRRQRLRVLEKPRLELSALRFAQRLQSGAGHE